jgi:predicted MFS family arabinose efflux permease
MGFGSLVGGIISFAIFNGIDYFDSTLIWLKFSPFLIFGFVNIFAGIQFYFKVDENLKYEDYIRDMNIIIPNEKKKTNEISLLKSLLKIKKSLFFGLLLVSFASIFSSWNNHMNRPFIQLYMSFEYFSSDTLVMLVMYAAQTIAMIIAPKIGIMADKINPMVGIAFVSLFGSIVTFCLITVNSPFIFIFLLILDFSMAMTGMLFTQNLFSRLTIKHRGKMFGLVEWMALIGWIIGPIVGGIFWDDHSHKSPFILSIFLEISLIPLFWGAIRLLEKEFDENIES